MDNINRIAEKITTNIKNTAFFVGAGISKNSGLPDFYNFNKQILQLTTGSDDKEIIDSLRPEVMLQAMKDELGEQSMSCLEMFRNGLLKPNLNHKTLAEVLAKGGMVITTNWDDLIEMACFEKGIKYQVIHTEEQYEKIMSGGENTIGHNSDCVQIFKIHGNIVKHNDNSFDFGSIQMTLNDVGGGLSKGKKKFLDYVHTNHTMCFIGYGAMDDFDILPSIRINHTDKQIFWIKYEKINSGNTFLKEQIEYENKSLDIDDEKYYKIKNVNDILLTCDNPEKIKADPCKFMKCLFASSEECTEEEKSDNNIVFDNFKSFAKHLEKSKKDFLLANLYEKIGKVETAMNILENILKQSEKKEDSSDAYYRLAGILNKFYGKKMSSKIISYYDKAIEYTTSDNRKAEFLISKANYLRREEKRYDDTEKCLNEAEPLISDKRIHVNFLNIKGLLYLGRKKPEIAEKYFQESYQNRDGNAPGLAESSNAIGLALMYQEKLEESRKWFDIALDLNLRTANYRGAGQQCLNLIRWHAKSIEQTDDMQEIKRLFSEGNKIYDHAKQYWSYLTRSPTPELERLERKLRKCEMYYAYVLVINDKNMKMHHTTNTINSLENILKDYKLLDHKPKIKQCENLISKFQKLT